MEKRESSIKSFMEYPVGKILGIRQKKRRSREIVSLLVLVCRRAQSLTNGIEYVIDGRSKDRKARDD
jgi:hypothetical protein